MASPKFDIVVYGATGFTGQLVAEYLAAHYKGDAGLKWAMAGRSKEKLASVRDAIGAPADTPLIVADASDPASLKAMVEEATAASVALNDEAQTLKALATRFRVSGSSNAKALASVAQQMRTPVAAAPSYRAAPPAPRRAAAASRGSTAVAQDSWEEF